MTDLKHYNLFANIITNRKMVLTFVILQTLS